MVSRRQRAKQTVGAQLSKLSAETDGLKKEVAGSPGKDTISEENLTENSVGGRQLIPGAVDSAALGRGAVGTENLGIINGINSDGSFKLKIPQGNLSIEGAEYSAPAGKYRNMTVDENGLVSLRTDGEVDWDSVLSKPATFPPTAHNHDAGQIVTGQLPDARLSSTLQEVAQWSGPARPAFQAGLTTNWARSGTTSYLRIPFTAEYLDQGGHYDAPNARFIAPAAGLYQFTFSLAVTTNIDGPEVRLVVNGSSVYGNLAIGYGAAYNTFGTSALVVLGVSDTVEVFLSNNNSTSFTISDDRTFFSGHYIG